MEPVETPQPPTLEKAINGKWYFESYTATIVENGSTFYASKPNLQFEKPNEDAYIDFREDGTFVYRFPNTRVLSRTWAIRGDSLFTAYPNVDPVSVTNFGNLRTAMLGVYLPTYITENQLELRCNSNFELDNPRRTVDHVVLVRQ